MKAKALSLSALLSLVVGLNSAFGSRGADVPWVTYEAENGTYTGSLLGPTYSPNVVSSESSGRECVRLSATGQYVQFTAVSNANAIVVRYSVPDTANGVGTNYTLSLYTNGVFAAELPVTSMYSWLYGAYPFTNNPSAGSPRNFYDEVRTNGWTINAGDVIRLQKNSTDTASHYDIDLVDLENVSAPISQPNGFVSITTYGAAGDGSNDDTSALQNCINATNSVYLPPGNYKITALINLPSNRTIQGAGMWYTTLVGDPTLYTTSSRRVTLNGNGSNIHLSDLAIVGKLNYRNDSEPNDGLGGSYGTGSTISNIWVEHTKTGAWIVNSLGLVVNSCRFRDTIADGINLVVGMRGNTVTNCTARGTGDDCFPIWPASYLTPVYAPGLNVITHCTGQVPFLANGGAIYGGDSNTIQDCLFKDIPYGCGILFSTIFPVSASFSGTTVAQRCDVIRCGATLAGLEINMQDDGIPGLNLNNLNITNSATTGLKILDGTFGGLANAIMYDSNISTYNLSGSGGHGMWAQSTAVGSLTVSNCTVSEYRDDSSSFTFNFVTTNSIPVTFQTSPAGLSFTVDGIHYTTTQVLDWVPGSNHTISTSTPQSGGTGIQYGWGSWSDGGAISHTVVAPSTATTYTANFSMQYYLTMNAGTGGTVSPATSWNNSGATVNISASASSDYSFSSWSGSGTGSYSGGSNPSSVTMNGPITETANFTLNNAISVTVQTSPAGLSFTVDGTQYTTTQVFTWAQYSGHTISTSTPQNGGTLTQYVWSSWSDGGAILHAVAPSTTTTYTANFTTQYYLTMNAGTGGAVSPASGWNDNGAVVNISATAFGGYSFDGWNGSGSGSYSGTTNPSTVTLSAPVSEAAVFTFVPNILGMTSSNGLVGLNYATVSGLTYHVETTTDLNSPWVTVPGSTTNSAGGLIIFIDPNATGDTQRFYRIGSP